MARGYLSEIFASFQGEGLYVGRRHLFLRLAGCHLRCRYCDTPESLERTDRLSVRLSDGAPIQLENPISGPEVLAHCETFFADGHLDGLAITGGEPLLQSEFLAELLSDPRWPRPRLLETSGTLSTRLERILPLLDVVSMDIKLPSNTGEAPFWEEHRRFLAIAGDKAYVKVLVDDTTALSDLDRAARLIAETTSSPVFLQPITRDDGHVAIQPASLTTFFSTAKRHLSDVRVLPQTHKFLGIA